MNDGSLGTLTPDDTDTDQPAGLLRALWERGARPDVAEFLAGREELPARALVEVLRVDQRFRYLAGEPVQAGDYLRRFPIVACDTEASFTLIYAEFLLREDLGDRPCADDYFRHYPELADRLRLQLEVHHVVDFGLTVPLNGSTRRWAVPSHGRALPTVPGFETLELLGHGGMGVVYKARHLRLGRLVALKMIHPALYPGPEQLARFRVEAETVARLQHPNVVQIHDVIEGEGRPCLELEYIGGGSLAQKIAAAPLGPSEAAALVETIARAVNAAHRLGVVHRDLKPANILLTDDRVPKVTDFGLAKYLHAEQTLTRSEAILGSPCYMAPEQADGESSRVGPAADVYALGVVLYEALTGRPPFKAATTYATLEQVKIAAPIPPSRLQPGLSRDLETVCLKCLHKEPFRRYSSAEALADDLARFRAGVPVHARPVGTAERAWRWCRRKPAVAGLAAATVFLMAVLALGGSAAFLGTRERLWESLVRQAAAQRQSGQVGQRLNSLKALADAARIRRSSELRDEVVASLALVDLQVHERWPGNPLMVDWPEFDQDLTRYAINERKEWLEVRRVPDGKVLSRLKIPGGVTLTAFGFSPDGRFMAAGHKPKGNGFEHAGDAGYGYVIWNTESGAVIFERKLPRRVWGICAFSADSQRVVLDFADKTVRVLEVTSGQEVGRASNLIDEPWCSAVNPRDGTLALAGRDVPGATLYGTDRESEPRRLTLPNRVRYLAWSGDGTRLAAACDDFSAYLWDVSSGAPPVRFAGHKAEVYRVGFSGTGDLLFSTSWDDTTRFFNAWSGRELLAAEGQAVRFRRDGRRLAFRDWGENLGVWDVVTSSEFRYLPPDREGGLDPGLGSGGSQDVDFSPDGRYVAASGAGGVRVWESATARQLVRLPAGQVTSVAFHPNGRGIVSFGPRGLFLWPFRADSDAGGLVAGPPRDLAGPVYDTVLQRISWAPDGRTLAVNDWRSGRLLLIDPETAARRREFAGRPALFGSAFSRDGRWVAGGTRLGGGATVWDAHSGREVAKLPGSRPNASDAEVAFSPNGQWLVTGNQAEYRFYSVGSWQPGRVIPRRKLEGWPGPLAYSRDGRFLALALTPVRVQLLDAATNEPVITLTPADCGELRALRFSRDSRLLAAATAASEVLIWDLAGIHVELAKRGLD
jgi:WD40 repeat protein